jgi:hypothetical protein
VLGPRRTRFPAGVRTIDAVGDRTIKRIMAVLWAVAIVSYPGVTSQQPMAIVIVGGTIVSVAAVAGMEIGRRRG